MSRTKGSFSKYNSKDKYYDDDYVENSKKERRVNKNNEKRIVRALKTQDIEELLEYEDDI